MPYIGIRFICLILSKFYSFDQEMLPLKGNSEKTPRMASENENYRAASAIFLQSKRGVRPFSYNFLIACRLIIKRLGLMQARSYPFSGVEAKAKFCSATMLCRYLIIAFSSVQPSANSGSAFI
jgi:hypothetical protein